MKLSRLRRTLSEPLFTPHRAQKARANPSPRGGDFVPPTPRRTRSAGAVLAEPHRKMVANVARLGTWAGELEISTLAKVYQFCVKLWRPVGDDGQYALSGSYGSGNAVHIAYRSEHYEALSDVRGDSSGVACKATPAKTPADGDCLYHAVAESAGFPEMQIITAAYRHGGMAELRQNAHIMAWVDNHEQMNDQQLYSELRRCYVLQMRHDVAREWSHPSYAIYAEEGNR